MKTETKAKDCEIIGGSEGTEPPGATSEMF